jgi:hypothetical protein
MANGDTVHSPGIHNVATTILLYVDIRRWEFKLLLRHQFGMGNGWNLSLIRLYVGITKANMGYLSL